MTPPLTLPSITLHDTQYLHQAFKNAGGGRIPTELLPLYASDPVEADVKAAATIAAALAENEERGATTGMLGACVHAMLACMLCLVRVCMHAWGDDMW